MPIDYDKLCDGHGVAEIRDWVKTNYLRKDDALSSKLHVRFGPDFVGQTYTITDGGTETYTGTVPQSRIVEQSIQSQNATYTVSCENSGGSTKTVEIEIGSYYGIYKVDLFTFLAYLNCTTIPNGAITVIGGGTTLSVNANAEGRALVEVYTAGDYSATSVLEVGNTYTRTVSVVTDGGTYACPIATRYGYKRDKNMADCDARIEYLYDAEGMAPARMSYDGSGNGTFDYGSWGGFVEEVSRPVMLRSNGSVDYELDHADQTKKLDGTASDVANTSYDGNAMTEFGKAYRWVKRYQDTNHEYVIFANWRPDSSYHAYAHTDDTGAVKDAFYLGMFDGMSDSGNKLRSICTGSPMTNQNSETEISRAKANGAGWNILYKSAQNYVADLLTLISKSDNSQACFGDGVDSRLNSLKALSLSNVPAFYGTNTGKQSVKVFWLVDFWGNMWQRMHGCVYDGQVKVKMTGPYCDTPVSSPNYSSYTPTGITLPSYSQSFIKKTVCTDEYGYLFTEAGGANGQYMSDATWTNPSQMDFAFVGASYSDASGNAGSRCLNLNNLASNSNANIGARQSA